MCVPRRRLRRAGQRGLPREVLARSPRRGARRRRLRSAPPQVTAHEAGPLRTPALSARPVRLRCPGGGRGLAAGPGRSPSVALPLRRPPAAGSFLQPAGPKKTGSGASLGASPRVSSAPRAARDAPRSPLTLRAAAAIAPGALPGVAAAAGPGRGGAGGGQRAHRLPSRMRLAHGEAAARVGHAPLRARGRGRRLGREGRGDRGRGSVLTRRGTAGTCLHGAGL